MSDMESERQDLKMYEVYSMGAIHSVAADRWVCSGNSLRFEREDKIVAWFQSWDWWKKTDSDVATPAEPLVLHEPSGMPDDGNWQSCTVDVYEAAVDGKRAWYDARDDEWRCGELPKTAADNVAGRPSSLTFPMAILVE